jgi:hypothetical protein
LPLPLGPKIRIFIRSPFMAAKADRFLNRIRETISKPMKICK